MFNYKILELYTIFIEYFNTLELCAAGDFKEAQLILMHEMKIHMTISIVEI